MPPSFFRLESSQGTLKSESTVGCCCQLSCYDTTAHFSKKSWLFPKASTNQVDLGNERMCVKAAHYKVSRFDGS